MNSSRVKLEAPEFLAWPAYILSVLLVVSPLSDVVLSMGTLQPSAVAWRFGAIGLVAGSIVLPLGGLFLGYAVSHVYGRTWIGRIYLGLIGLGAVALVGSISLFILDAVQMRAAVLPQRRQLFDFNVVRALGIQLLSATFLSWLLIGGIRADRNPRKVVKTDRGSSDAVIVVSGSRGI